MNLAGALNRRSSEIHHQALILAAIIYQVLTMTAVNLLKPHMHRRERISVEKVFDLMFDHLMNIQDLREWSDIEADRRHIRMDPRKDRNPLVDTWLQIIS